MNRTALLLVILFSRHYGWRWFPPDQQGRVFNIFGALAMFGMLYWFLKGSRGIELSAGLLLVLEESMLASCSLARFWFDWTTPLNQGQCSGLLGYDIGTICLTAIAVLCAQYVSLTGSARQKSGDNL